MQLLREVLTCYIPGQQKYLLSNGEQVNYHEFANKYRKPCYGIV